MSLFKRFLLSLCITIPLFSAILCVEIPILNWWKHRTEERHSQVEQHLYKCEDLVHSRTGKMNDVYKELDAAIQLDPGYAVETIAFRNRLRVDIEFGLAPTGKVD